MQKKSFIVLSILVLTIVAPVLYADDTVCVGTIVGTHDNVLVPADATCVINSALIQGNLKILERGRVVVNTSTINGNVEGDKAGLVQLVNSTVRQNVTIKEGGGTMLPVPPSGWFCFVGGLPATPCQAYLRGGTVQEGNVQIEKMAGTIWLDNTAVLKGNVKFEENVAPSPAEFLAINGSNTPQNIQVFKNTGTGPKFVFANTARESVQCFDNTAPFFGGPNTAPNKEGQCF